MATQRWAHHARRKPLSLGTPASGLGMLVRLAPCAAWRRPVRMQTHTSAKCAEQVCVSRLAGYFGEWHSCAYDNVVVAALTWDVVPVVCPAPR